MVLGPRTRGYWDWSLLNVKLWWWADQFSELVNKTGQNFPSKCLVWGLLLQSRGVFVYCLGWEKLWARCMCMCECTRLCVNKCIQSRGKIRCTVQREAEQNIGERRRLCVWEWRGSVVISDMHLNVGVGAWPSFEIHLKCTQNQIQRWSIKLMASKWIVVKKSI